MLCCDLWKHRWEFRSRNFLPWLLLGDFNEYGLLDEKKEGCYSYSHAQTFRDNINAYHYLDLEDIDNLYTWVKIMSGLKTIQTYFNKALANEDWCVTFPESSVTHLSQVNSDRSPILVKVAKYATHPYTKPSRFEAA